MVFGSCVIDGHRPYRGSVTSRLADQAFRVSAQLAATRMSRAVAPFIGALPWAISERRVNGVGIGDPHCPQTGKKPPPVVNPLC